MNNRNMADIYLRMAEIRLAAAKNAQNQKGYAFAVQLCQETAELESSPTPNCYRTAPLA